MLCKLCEHDKATSSKVGLCTNCMIIVLTQIKTDSEDTFNDLIQDLKS